MFDTSIYVCACLLSTIDINRLGCKMSEEQGIVPCIMETVVRIVTWLYSELGQGYAIKCCLNCISLAHFFYKVFKFSELVLVYRLVN